MAVEIQAEANETNLLVCQDSGGDPKSRIDAAGTFITKVNDEPDSADLENGECALWYNGSDTIYFKARNLSGVIVVGEVKLS